MSIPLHPAVVHFPLVLAMLLPLVAAGAVLFVRRGGDPRKSWFPVVLTAALLTVSSFVAVRTGEAEEETVEAVVPRDAIHEHEERAELFLPLTAALLLVTAVGLAPGRAAVVARWTSLGGAVVVAGLALLLGHSGGELVYVHGAGAAYVTTAGTGDGYDEAGHDRDPGAGHDDDDGR